MTDETIREQNVIQGAKLYYEGMSRPSRHLGCRYQMGADSFRAYCETGELQIMRYRVFFMCGYDPQMLLPAPSFEREIMQSISEWAEEQIKLPYTEFANSVFNTLTRDGEVTFSPTGRYIEDPSLYSVAHLLADSMTRIIKAMTPREAPVLVVGTDFADVEKKVISYMHATFVHESAGGSPTPRGKIELFDEIDAFRGYVRDHTGVTSAMLDESSILKRKAPPREHATQDLKRSQSYLDHDPTKRHKRRKKK